MHRPLLIGVFSPIPGGPYFGGLVGGINRAAAAAGGRVVVVQTLDPALTGYMSQRLSAPQFDVPIGWERFNGVISLVEAVRPPYLHRLSSRGMPFVTMSKQVEGLQCPSVLPDNAGGIEAALDHLLGHGYRRIAFVGDLRQSDIRERFDSYRSTLRRHGIDPDDSLFFAADDNLLGGGYRAGQLMLAAGVRPQALIAATDPNAIGLMQAVREAGWSLPGDLPVVGFDNTAEASQVRPPLTTVAVPLDRLGELAGDLLIAKINGEAVRPGVHLGSATLMIRQSCGCGQDLIRRQAGGGLQLTAGLRDALAPEATPPSSMLRRLDALATKIAALFDDPSQQLQDEPAAIESLVEDLYDLGPRAETIRQVIAVIRAYTDGLAAAGAPRPLLDGRLIDLTMAMREFEARASADFRGAVERRLEAHYEVGVALLRSDQQDPAMLSWFGRTNASAGCLAMWAQDDRQAEPGELTITGVYGQDLAAAGLVGTSIAAESFPPSALIDQIDAGAGEVAHVVMVRSEDTLWGILAAPSNVAALCLEGREPFNDWSAFLALAFEQRRSRDDLQAVHRRERRLTEHLRVSEERYSLAARAANDGLWDWDLSDNTVFYSDRWRTVVGVPSGELDCSPEEWFSRVHPDDLAALHRALNACVNGEAGVLLNEHRVLTGHLAYRWMSCRAIGVPGAEGTVERLVGALTDIDERRQLEERLRHAALHDALTGLPNRMQFLEHLQSAFAEGEGAGSDRYAVLFCDLDGFKKINDTLGHHIGDLLLSAVAGRLAEAVRGSDLVARLGGDEFAVLLPHIDDTTLHEVVERIRRKVGEPFDLEGHSVTVGTSVGVATSDVVFSSPAALLREADAAMYRVKTVTAARRT